MRRWVPMALVAALLAGCGHSSVPRPTPVFYDVVFGVAIFNGDNGNAAYYEVDYVDDEPGGHHETVQGGKSWSHRSKVASKDSAVVTLSVAAYPANLLSGYPKIGCRIFVSNIMVGGEDKELTCSVALTDSDIKHELAKASQNAV
jgi:hypothetical protein